jgi:hypothetical protein
LIVVAAASSLKQFTTMQKLVFVTLLSLIMYMFSAASTHSSTYKGGKWEQDLCKGLIVLANPLFQYGQLQEVRFRLKNNQPLPVKITIISYRPDESGNGTTTHWLLPFASKAVRFPTGTKIYLANQQQVNTVMSGKRIDGQTPFLTVKKEDLNRIFKIN